MADQPLQLLLINHWELASHADPVCGVLQSQENIACLLACKQGLDLYELALVCGHLVGSLLELFKFYFIKLEFFISLLELAFHSC